MQARATSLDERSGRPLPHAARVYIQIMSTAQVPNTTSLPFDPSGTVWSKHRATSSSALAVAVFHVKVSKTESPQSLRRSQPTIQPFSCSQQQARASGLRDSSVGAAEGRWSEGMRSKYR